MKALFQSGVAGERLARAGAWLGRQPRKRRLLILSPSPLAATRLLSGCVGAAQACFGWERMTLDQLALRLATAALARAGRSPLSALAEDATCTRALDRLSQRRELGRFSAVQTRPGLPRALAATVRELALAELEPEAVARTAPDLARFYAEYRALLAEGNLVDRAQLLSLARKEAERNAHPLVGLPVLMLDLALHHRAEQRLACALLERARDSLATLPAGDARSRDALRATTDGDNDGGGGAPSLWDGALARLQAHLFEEHAPRGELEGEVVVMSAPGESRESVEVARRLLWAAERGVPFDRMAVLLRTPRAYRSHLEEALERARVPAFFAGGSARPDPSGRALLALLACKDEGLSARAFAEYLSLDTVPRLGARGEPPPAGDEEARWVAPDAGPAADAVAEEGLAAEPPDETASDSDPAAAGRLRAPRRWERLLVDAAVIGGLPRWRRRLDGLRAGLLLQRDEALREGSPEAEALERELRDLEHLNAFALPVLEELAALPERARWGQWLSALRALAVRVLHRPERVLAVLTELEPMAELGPLGLPEVRRVLLPRLSELVERPQRDAAGKVFVADIDDARGLDFELVCVMGLAEKVFPQRVGEDPILLDDDRHALDPALASTEQRVAGERLLLRIAVGAARSSLVLSYPRIDLERARPRVPSFYGLEVLRAAEGELPGYAKLMRRADEVASARIGWPAPPDPLSAVDEAEHDLSLLAEILARDPGDTRGSARYLLHVNPHLARALRFRARRWSVRPFTQADGLCEPSDAARRALAAHRLSERPAAVSSLELYAQCPYRFALRSLHRLVPRAMPAPIERMDPRERGVLMHEVQFELLSRLRDAKLLPLDAARLPEAQALLDATLDEVAERHRERLAPAIERVWQDGVAVLGSDLKQWLGRSADDAWRPLHFELGFGLSHQERSDPHSRPEPVMLAGGALLRGSIDLVETNADRLRATDHKSGKPSAGRDMVTDGGRHLQPLLYALALEALLPGREVQGGRLYYCTVDGGFETREVPLIDETRHAVHEVLATIDSAIDEGFLPAAPEKDACARCDYLPICGPYEEQRVQHKDQGRLVPLERLRNQP